MTTAAEVIAIGVLLGLVYTLAALGLQVSLGVLRVLNLAHGIIIIAGAFFAFDLLHAWQITPLLAVLVALPVFCFTAEGASYASTRPLCIIATRSHWVASSM